MNYRSKLTVLGLLPGPVRRSVMRRRYDKDLVTGERELRELGKFVDRQGTAIDVGCNYGVYSYALSRLAGRVIAFEPNPDLARFVSGLRVPRLEVRQVALSSTEGMADFAIPAGFHQEGSLRFQSAIPAGATTFKVATATLDSMDFRNVQFIKIDVEGFEEEMLAGAMRTIGRELPHVLIEIEERHNPGGLDRIRASFSKLGYHCLFLDDRDWRSADQFDVDRHQPTCPSGSTTRDPASRYINNFLFAPAQSHLVH